MRRTIASMIAACAACLASTTAGAAWSDYHVGPGRDFPTIQAAVDAINSETPADPSAQRMIFVHTGRYEMSSTVVIPALTVVRGAGAVQVYNPSSTMFRAGGDGVMLDNLNVEGSDAPGPVFDGDDRKYLTVSNMYVGGGSQQVIRQVGPSWHTMFVQHLIVDSARGSGWAFTFGSTSGLRYNDLEINDVFSDTYHLGSQGGSFELTSVRDVRFRDCKIRGVPGLVIGINLVGAGSWMEVHSSVFQKMDDGTDSTAFSVGSGTSALVTSSFAPHYSGSGTVISPEASSTPGPAGPQGPPGPPGPQGTGCGLTESYDLDLSSVPQTDLLQGGDGPKTIDGRPWTLVNGSTASEASVGPGRGGLYLRTSTANVPNYGSWYGGPRVVVPFADLTGVQPRDSSEQWVLFLFSQPHEPSSNYEFAYFGVQPWPGLPDTSHSRPVFELARGYGSPQVMTVVEWQWGSTVVQTPSGVTPPPVADDVYAMRVLATGVVEAYSGSSSGGDFPPISSLTFVARANFSPPQQGFWLTGSQWAAVFSVANSNTLGRSDVLLRRIRHYYR
jgi:hypothetical protein